MSQPSILIALAGSLDRQALSKFERLGCEFGLLGYGAAFLRLPDAPEGGSEVRNVSLELAARASWAAVMIAGSQFPPDCLAALTQLKADNFGVRVQYVLDGQSQRTACLKVNNCFAPHVLVFSHSEWPVGSFTEFQAERFEVTTDITRAERTLNLIAQAGRRYYSYSPEAGMWGKWPLEVRLHGLEPLLQEAAERKVIDLGSAEGLVAREFLLNGAARVEGFDVDSPRIEDATRLCGAFAAAEFRVADLADWRGFRRSNPDVLDGGYDIVLYLGLHQHLPADSRLETLSGALQLTRDYFAIRTSDHVYEADQIEELLARANFHLVSSATKPDANVGTLRIYRKAPGGRIG